MRRSAGIAVLALSALVFLTGCTPEARIFASLLNGAPAFLICDPIAVAAIDVSEVPDGAEIDDKRDLWSLRGAADFGTESLVRMSKVPPGFIAQEDAALYDPNAQLLEIALNSGRHEDLPEELDIRVASFDPATLIEGMWVNQVGEEKSDPCG